MAASSTLSHLRFLLVSKINFLLDRVCFFIQKSKNGLCKCNHNFFTRWSSISSQGFMDHEWTRPTGNFGTLKNHVLGRKRSPGSVVRWSLFKVEYAQESVERGSIAVGIKGANCIVLGTEKKSQSSSLMMGRTMSKICFIDRKGEIKILKKISKMSFHLKFSIEKCLFCIWILTFKNSEKFILISIR